MTIASPFIGPRPFTEDDATLFFGRSDDLAALSAEIMSTQIVLLFAASATGKSSLVSAGLAPTLRASGFEIVSMRIGANAQQWDGYEQVSGAITHATRARPQRPVLLILDQFEEALLSMPDAWLEGLATVIRAAVNSNPRLRVVVSFREEYLARADALFDAAPDSDVSRYHLQRLSRNGVQEVFERSLGSVGYRVAPDALDLFIKKLDQRSRRSQLGSAFEPLYVQLLGSQLWSSISKASDDGPPSDQGVGSRERVVTKSDVRQLVDFDEALEDFYHSAISDVCATNGVQQKVLRDWIDRTLVTPDETRSMVRRQVPETDGLRTEAVDALVARGLLRTEPRGDDTWIELSHDQLVERVRQFNRSWWLASTYHRLADRRSRYDLALAASTADLQRWIYSRTVLWSLGAAVRDSGLRMSEWARSRLSFGRAKPGEKLDRLALRGFVLAGTLVTSSFSTYLRVTGGGPDKALRNHEGFNAETAKRRLRATSLNLGRAEQALAAANVIITAGWIRSLSRLATRSILGASRADRRRQAVIVLLVAADVSLSLLRWAVRNGLLATCLSGDIAMPRSVAGSYEDADRSVGVVRCASLHDVNAMSADHPTLLVLDARPSIDADDEFTIFETSEVPLYQESLRSRGCAVAWCWRGDLHHRDWRQGIHGIGWPARGQRTYYMVENGSVVAWRSLRWGEGQALAALVQRSPEVVAAWRGREGEARKRFLEPIIALIIASEATGPPWLQHAEQVFRATAARREST